MVEQRLREWAAENGYRAAAGPASLLDEVREEIRRRGARGDLDPGFAGKWLGWISGSEDAAGCLSAQSVIAVVVPCPVTLVRFTLPGRVLAAVVPPTYCEDAQLGERVREQLLELLPELEGSLVQAVQGRKAIAARLGLAAYGVKHAPCWAETGRPARRSGPRSSASWPRSGFPATARSSAGTWLSWCPEGTEAVATVDLKEKAGEVPAFV
jgi:hypothetical protein